MSLFRLDASISPATSATRALGDLVEREWAAARPHSSVVRRDLAAEPVPAELWTAAVTAAAVDPSERTDLQREAVALATTLADELIDAEAILLTVPLYNYGVSQHAKLWFDLAYTDPRIGPASEGGPLRGKPAVLVTATGGNYGPGTPKAGWDHSTDYWKRVLADVWGVDLHLVLQPFTLVGVNPGLDQFADVAASLRAQAEADTRAAGRSLAVGEQSQVA